MTNKAIFEHESLQDRKSVKKYLKVVMDGLSKGVITFSDGSAITTLEPGGLVEFRVSVSDDRGFKNLSLSMAWKDTDNNEGSSGKALQISSEDMIE